MKHYGLDIYSKKKQQRPHLRSVRFQGPNDASQSSQAAAIDMPQDISMFNIAKILLRFLAKHGAGRTPFIFQQVAPKESVKKLASAIISERDLDLSTYPIETIATTLKRILRALPVPIIHCQEQLFAILGDGSEPDEAIPLIRTLLKNELHPESLSFLTDLVKLLAEIAACQQQTQMSASSLAYLFGPTLMRVKTDSTIALLHDPKAINRAVQFFIEHSDSLFSFSKKNTLDSQSSESKPISKSRLFHKKIRMVLRRPFEKSQASNRNIEQGVPKFTENKPHPVPHQSMANDLIASIVFNEDEQELFRVPPAFNPPSVPSANETSAAAGPGLLTAKRHLSIYDQDPSTESGRYRMQLDAAKAEQMFVENARRREMEFLDEERRAQEAFTLRRTYSGNKETSPHQATPPVEPAPAPHELEPACCESDAGTDSTRTSISSASSLSVMKSIPPVLELQSSWWKDVQRLRDAAATAAASAMTPSSEDIPLDFDQPPSEPAPISPSHQDIHDTSSIESLSVDSFEYANEVEDPNKAQTGSDTDSVSSSSVPTTDSEPEQFEQDQHSMKAVEQTAPVVIHKIKRFEPSNRIAQRMQLFEQRVHDDDPVASQVSLKSIRAPGGILDRRAPVTKFKAIFEKQKVDIDVDDDVRVIESSPRVELSGATAVVRKGQWHAEAARDAPDTTTTRTERGYVQRIKNRLLSEPIITSPHPLSPSSRRSSASHNSWNDSITPNDTPKASSFQTPPAQPAIIRKLSMTRVQNLNRKLAGRPQSMDLTSSRTSMVEPVLERASFSETTSLKPFQKGSKQSSISENISTLPSGFYRIQNARRRDISGGRSQFSASDVSEEEEEDLPISTMHRSRPSLSATAFLQRLSTASSFADESVSASRNASIQVFDPPARTGSQAFVHPVVRVSVPNVFNEN